MYLLNCFQYAEFALYLWKGVPFINPTKDRFNPILDSNGLGILSLVLRVQFSISQHSFLSNLSTSSLPKF